MADDCSESTKPLLRILFGFQRWEKLPSQGLDCQITVIHGPHNGQQTYRLITSTPIVTATTANIAAHLTNPL